jgi:hypothetical protein
MQSRSISAATKQMGFAALCPSYENYENDENL